MNDFWTSWQPRILSVFRFIIGFLFFWHGTQKLFGFPPSQQGGGGELSTLMAVGGILELVGGVFIMLGIFTRWTAFILCGLMAFAYWGWHGTSAFLPIVNRGEMAVLYCFVFLYLFFAGGGSWSFDNFFMKKSEE
ncbi:MAG TPA: DoxX family protein [Pyrinomonadaceae bacterium]|nr:DoxX family protein [Pyrinomonadaceae bacterium]